MPLHDVGYRSWEGKRTSLFGRWSVVAKTGVSLAFRSTWLSRTLILSGVPAIVFTVFFFLYEQSAVGGIGREEILGVSAFFGASPDLLAGIATRPEEVRHEVWATLLFAFFRNPQAIAMVVIVGMVAPRLISADLRNRSYLLYFSRPVTPAGFILGKALVVSTFVCLITTIPALFMYVFGLCLSPDLSVCWDTWDLPFRILVASLFLVLPVSAVALACSAITIESRYAAFSWFSIWIVGLVAYNVLYLGEFAGRGMRRGRDELQQSIWEFLSPFHCLGRVQQYVFGVYGEDNSIIPYFVVITLVTVFGFWLVRNRVMSRLKA